MKTIKKTKKKEAKEDEDSRSCSTALSDFAQVSGIVNRRFSDCVPQHF
jgi:3-methyladenine DNA glycosylase Tag